MSHLISRTAILVCLTAGAPLLAQCAAQTPAGGAASAQRSPTPEPIDGVVRVEVVATGLELPWAVALLPDGRFLVTEKPGRLRLVERDGRLSAPIAGVPEVAARGQGGLLDVALDPR
ncbi:MAG TPA: PQQ-dependent sugar dehydrogenase, partial [Gemmatimonadaceae bacterium]